MRFRFCGDQDCPDWLLAEITLLSKVSSVKMKLLTTNMIKELTGVAPLDWGKVRKLTEDAKYEPSELKAFIATLIYILTSAAKYDCDAPTLANELQQLGLPKEHATALCKGYGDKLEKLQKVLLQKSLRAWNLESLDWRVDYVLGSSSLAAIQEPSVQLKMKVKGDPQAHMFTASADKFCLLLSELHQAEAAMAAID